MQPMPPKPPTCTLQPATGPAADTVSVLPAAAILDDGTGAADALLAAVVRRQQLSGWCVRGLLMRDAAAYADRSLPMVLVDLRSGEEYPVSQSLGRLSGGCRADPQGFAQASAVLRRAVEEGPDLMVCNRFGGMEAEGGGFRAELLAILASELPLLTVVQPRHQQAWEDFSGGAAVLPATAQALAAWLDALASRTDARAASAGSGTTA